jgi:hypothetical protein
MRREHRIIGRHHRRPSGHPVPTTEADDSGDDNHDTNSTRSQSPEAVYPRLCGIRRGPPSATGQEVDVGAQKTRMRLGLLTLANNCSGRSWMTMDGWRASGRSAAGSGPLWTCVASLVISRPLRIAVGGCSPLLLRRSADAPLPLLGPWPALRSGSACLRITWFALHLMAAALQHRSTATPPHGQGSGQLVLDSPTLCKAAGGWLSLLGVFWRSYRTSYR